MSVSNQTGYDHYPIPIGTLIPFAGYPRFISKDYYLLCDGTSYKKTDYPELYRVLGGIYGETTDSFNVPDSVGRYIKGTNTNANVTQTGGSGGASFGIDVLEENMPSLQIWDGTIGIDIQVGVDANAPSIAGDHLYIEADIPSSNCSKDNTFGTETCRETSGSGSETSINVNYNAGTFETFYTNTPVPAVVDVTSFTPTTLAVTYFIRSR
jgi:microcystin-dependent protein